MNVLNENWQEQLSCLLSLFSSKDTLNETAKKIGNFLSSQIQLETLIFMNFGDSKHSLWTDTGIWEANDINYSTLILIHLKSNWDNFVDQLSSGNTCWSNNQLNSPIFNDKSIRQFPIHFDDKLCGSLILVHSDNWNLHMNTIVDITTNLTGLTFAYDASIESEKLSSFLFNTVLDSMKSSIYITDPDTDNILFMNQTMKEAFSLEHPDGNICWKVLQNNMDTRCPFCPIGILKKQPLGSVYQWEEKNPVSGKIYNNYDSLIRWIDGRIVHLQQSIDITALKSANTDELTQLLTRRPGKLALSETLDESKHLGNTVTVCMYDINRLKEVNDLFGHAEGDILIATVSNAVCEILQENEYAFRLSGDEFIVVFYDTENEVKKRIEHAKKILRSAKKEYEISFCYGLVELSSNHTLTLEEVLFIADERMYEQKRKFHILLNEHRRLSAIGTKSGIFDYNKELLYNALLQSTDDYMYVCNMKTGIFKYPPAMVKEFDLPGEVIENAAAVWGSHVHEDDRAAFLESNQEITDGRTRDHCVEYRAKNRNNEWVWVRCRGHLEFDINGEPELFAGFITNLGLKNKMDHLTGLFNKVEFEDAVLHLTTFESKRGFGLMILGIDDLKNINDLYNRNFGDEVIRITAQKIQALLPETASLYRLDGDEFGILVRGLNTEGTLHELKKIYRNIKYRFSTQQEYDDKKYYCTLSAGALVYPHDADNFLDLIKYAEYSLSHSKKHGKNRCTFFSHSILADRSRALEIIELLRESVENNFEGFTLHFQPLVIASSGKLIGVEALSRWEYKHIGRISPIEFIPLLEQTGLIVPFGKWVLQTALQICKPWLSYLPELTVDVNISYLQLQEPDFIKFVETALIKEDFPSKNLILELTESYFAGENKGVLSLFKQLRKLGIRIAMDDFGTGYSTLGFLKEVPADIVKIDKTFVKDIQSNTFDATFIKFIVALCHDVNIQVCLEGVETESEYEFVLPMNLDFIQGYLFAKPMSEKEFIETYIN